MLRMEEFVDKLTCADAWTQACFLNTLSLLEYIGVRKILKSQSERRFDSRLLLHVSDEIRHSRILKRVAEKLAGRVLGFEERELLCGAQAKRYFQSLDQAVASQAPQSQHATDPWSAYRATTRLIEERALKLYPLLAIAFQERSDVAQAFRSILADERKHLAEARLTEDDRALDSPESELREVEEELFSAFIEELCGQLDSCRASEPPARSGSSFASTQFDGISPLRDLHL